MSNHEIPFNYIVPGYIFFLSPMAMKNLISPPRQTKSSDNFNVLHMFDNNTYTDFRTVLIPS